MEFWSQTAWYWELVFNLLMLAIPTLAGVAVLGGSASLGWRTVHAVRRFWKMIRAAIDEPTDPAIIFLALKSGKSPEVISKFLVENGDLIVAGLPEEAKPQGG